MNSLDMPFDEMFSDSFNPKIYYIIREEIQSMTPSYGPQEFLTLIHLLSGACNYTIDGNKYFAAAGDVIVCNPGTIHRKEPIPGCIPVEFNIGISDFQLAEFAENQLLSGNEYPIVKLSKFSSKFSECCEEILEEGQNNDLGNNLVLKALSMKLLAILLKERYGGTTVSKDQLSIGANDKRQIVTTILDFLNKNYMDDISLDSISKNMYLSSVYISKLFKEETGESPINHLIRIRLSKAHELLRTTNNSVKSVAEMVGYDDAYYFSKLFKKYYGCSPSRVSDSNDVWSNIRL